MRYKTNSVIKLILVFLRDLKDTIPSKCSWLLFLSYSCVRWRLLSTIKNRRWLFLCCFLELFKKHWYTLYFVTNSRSYFLSFAMCLKYFETLIKDGRKVTLQANGPIFWPIIKVRSHFISIRTTLERTSVKYYYRTRKKIHFFPDRKEQWTMKTRQFIKMILECSFLSLFSYQIQVIELHCRERKSIGCNNEYICCNFRQWMDNTSDIDLL